MKKIILLSLVLSTISYSDFNLWEETLDIEPGYKPIEISTLFWQKNIEKETIGIKKLDNIYFLKSSINQGLIKKLTNDLQEKNFFFNPEIIYIRYEKYKAPILNMNFGFLMDTTRYGLNFSFADGKEKSIGSDMENYQLNLYFNTQEENTNLFGTLYLGKTKYNGVENEKDFYYGYYQYFEQKYESFYYETLNYGYYTILDISRIETDKKNKNYNNDSIEGNLGILIEKSFLDKFKIRLASGIGKEFLENKKYKTISKDEFEEYINTKLEISTKIQNYLDIFTGVEMKKSLKVNNYENIIYFGFKLNL